MIINDKDDIKQKILNYIHGKSSELSFTNDEITKLNEINLSHQNITNLPNDVFNQLVELEVIDLSNNKLTNLDAKLFDRLTKLQMLILSNNQLKSLNKKIFSNLSKLNIINLSNNQIDNLDVDLFNGLVELNRLDVSKNKLNSLNENIFKNLTKLMDIDLSENELTELDENIFLNSRSKYLHKIVCNKNRIRQLPEKIFCRQIRHETTIPMDDSSEQSPMNNQDDENTNDNIIERSFDYLPGLKTIHFIQNRI